MDQGTGPLPLRLNMASPMNDNEIEPDVNDKLPGSPFTNMV